MGGDLYFHRPRPPVVELWQRTHFVQDIGSDHLFPDKATAIASIVPKLDGAICARCTARIFHECANQPGPAQGSSAGAEPQRSRLGAIACASTPWRFNASGTGCSRSSAAASSAAAAAVWMP